MWFKVKVYFLIKGNFLIIYEYDWFKGKESIIKNWILKRFILIFIVDLEKWFQIIIYFLLIFILYVNYKLDRVNGENVWFR